MKATAFCFVAVLNPLLVRGQGNATTNGTVVPLCFQPRQADHPNATELANFVEPSIGAACAFLGDASSNVTDAIVPVVFNLTGYGLAKMNIDALPGNMTECTNAFNAIISGCISTSLSFGGQ